MAANVMVMVVRRTLLAAWVVACALWLLPASPMAAACHLDLGSPAPELKGNDTLGNWHQLADYRGQWVFVDFWATWCKPCMRKLPKVVKLDEELGARPDFSVLSVSLDQAGAEQKLLSTAEHYGVRFPVFYDGDGWLSGNARNWCVEAIPATFLIDPKGRVVARDVPPGEIEEIIGAAARDDYRAIQISSHEELLSGSPSTGNSGYLDLVVSVDMQGDSPDIHRYLLEVMYTRPAPPDTIMNTLRYEINVTPLPAGASFPYNVEILQLEREYKKNAWLAFDDYIHIDSWHEINMQGMSAVVDLAARTYRFEVPLPHSCTSVAYRLSLYDAARGQFVSNGVRRLDTAAGRSS